jgi:hypothetical protein
MKSSPSKSMKTGAGKKRSRDEAAGSAQGSTPPTSPSSSSQSPRGTDPVCLVLTGAEVEGSTIPEAVPVEGVVLVTEVATGAATEPMETTAPGVTEEVRGDALPEVNLEVVVRSPEI